MEREHEMKGKKFLLPAFIIATLAITCMVGTFGAPKDALAQVSILHSFGGSSVDGTIPYGGLTVEGSTLYGTTVSGGAQTLAQSSGSIPTAPDISNSLASA
jgi:hypothetical protein